MHLAALDQMSNNGLSFLHRIRAMSKILMAGFFIVGVVATGSVLRLTALLFILAVLLVLSKNNLKEILHLAVYPLFFSSVFALLQLQHSYTAALLVVLKALGAAVTLLLLISTTPYIEIFSFFSLFMPALLVDIFVFTYRSLFILLDKLQSLLRSVKLKGGSHPLKILINLRNTAGMLGVLIIHSFDMSERMYRIYTLRGYNGHIAFTPNTEPIKAADVLLVVFSVIILIGMVIPWHL